MYRSAAMATREIRRDTVFLLTSHWRAVDRIDAPLQVDRYGAPVV